MLTGAIKAQKFREVAKKKPTPRSLERKQRYGFLSVSKTEGEYSCDRRWRLWIFGGSCRGACASESGGRNCKNDRIVFRWKDVVENKYHHGKEHLNRLASFSYVTVRHGIDATKFGDLFVEDLWDSSVWNFPHPAHNTQDARREGRELLTKFLENTGPSLKIDGSIYLTMHIHQRKRLALNSAARDAALSVVSKLPFCSSNIDGYEPKRSVIDDTIQTKYTNCSTYRLCLACDDEMIGNICSMLEEAGGELSLETFKTRYKKKYRAFSKRQNHMGKKFVSKCVTKRFG